MDIFFDPPLTFEHWLTTCRNSAPWSTLHADILLIIVLNLALAGLLRFRRVSHQLLALTRMREFTIVSGLLLSQEFAMLGKLYSYFSPARPNLDYLFDLHRRKQTAEQLANILAQRIQTTTDAPNKVGKIQAKLLLLMHYLDDMRDSLATYLPDPHFAGSTQSLFTRLEMTALRKYEHQDLLLIYCLCTILRDELDVDLQRRSVRSHNFNGGDQAQFPLLFFLAGLNAVSDIMVQPGCCNRSRRMASHLHRTHTTNPNLAQNTSQLVLLPRPLTPLLNRQLAREVIGLLPGPTTPLDNPALNLLGINGLVSPSNFNAVTHFTQYFDS